MPRFTYTARNRSGQAVSDTLEAASRKDALRLLSARGLTPQRVEEAVTAKAVKTTGTSSAAKPKSEPRRAKDRGSKPLTSKARLPFLQAIYDLAASGLSAGESVRLLALRIQEPTMKQLCSGLWERLSEGATLSRAMSDFPEVFDTSTIHLIQAGEATGNLKEVLQRLITHLQEAQELRRQVLSALAYPVFVMFMAGGVILFFIFFLLPRLQTLLNALGGKLPLSTQILVGVSDFCIHYGVFVVGAAIFAGLSFWRWQKSAAGRERLDSLLLDVPLVGPFLVSRTILSFSQTLSVLLENGITAAESLKMTERQIENTYHRRALSEAIGRILEGEAISSALQRMNCFPPLMLDQLAIGENTGNIVPSLRVISSTYQRAISHQLNLFTKVLSNVVLLAVFSFVGFIAFAIVSAVFQLSSSFKM